MGQLPEVQTVLSHGRTPTPNQIWTDDAVTLFPPPSSEFSNSIDARSPPSPMPNVPFYYDSSTEKDQEEVWTSAHPTPVPIQVYYHCKGHRYRTNSRRNLQWIWRLEIQEGYTGSFQEWEFAVHPGWYDFKCNGNPLVILGKYNGTVHMFSYELQRQVQFARQGLLLPIDRSTSPTPCYLEQTLCRQFCMGGFLHPSFWNLPSGLLGFGGGRLVIGFA